MKVTIIPPYFSSILILLLWLNASCQRFDPVEGKGTVMEIDSFQMVDSATTIDSTMKFDSTMALDSATALDSTIAFDSTMAFDSTNVIMSFSAKNEIDMLKARLHRQWINMYIGFVMILLIVAVLFVVIRMKTDKIQELQNELYLNYHNLDERLLDIVRFQPIVSDDTDNHSFALKVADEIVRIEMNLYRMDKSTKGYKQLAKAVERIKDNFMAHGYEIVDMLGKNYDEGMRLHADFVIDETLEEGTRLITAITKPQINYKGKIIQKAIVTVSQNI